jgi:hypothetical protein
MLELGGAVDPRWAGGYLQYDHRITEAISAFARGEVGWDFVSRAIDGSAQAGLRVRF